MSSLDSRKVRILQAIVNDYVKTTRPVGSERLIEIYHLGCKSATVRNEMAELSELGYLAQPHTSAGRIPTDRGYRYYVDELLDPPSALSPAEVRRASNGVQQAERETEEILLQTCRILSGLTACASLATDPSTGSAQIQRIYLTNASPRHVLLVLLLTTGHVEHRLVEMEAAPEDNELIRLANFINSIVAGYDLEEVARASVTETPPELAFFSGAINRIFSALAQRAGALLERRIFVEGTHQFLRQPEFQDVQRLEGLLNALEQRSALYRVLSRALSGEEVTAIIGVENAYKPMQECSVVATAYRIGSRAAGYLAVVGPTRMDYDRAAAAVNLMAKNLSRMLTNLSFA